MEGNQMKMREAMEAINCIDIRRMRRLLCELVEADIFDGGLINKTISAVEKARRALASPPRQCDVGTAEEQSERMEKTVCSKHHGCVRCPLRKAKYSDCSLEWAQTPYEAEEGGAE